MGTRKNPINTYEDAIRIAVKLASLLSKATWKIAPAGDLRLHKPFIHRIKLAAIPKWQKNLLNQYDYQSDSLMDQQLNEMGIHYKLDKATKHFYYDDYPVEIHTSTRRDSWGLLYLRITGPKAFSTWATINKPWGALPPNYSVKHDTLFFHDEAVSTPSEKSFFHYIGMRYVPIDARSVRFDYIKYLPKIAIENLV
jgi:hypothetical protein